MELLIAPVLHAEMVRDTCVVRDGKYLLLISYDNVRYFKSENSLFVREKMLEIEDWTAPNTAFAVKSKYDLHLCNINNRILSTLGLPVKLIKDSKPYRGLALLS